MTTDWIAPTAGASVPNLFERPREAASWAFRVCDLVVGGPNLAAKAFSAGLVDDCHVFLPPVLVGGGTPALPEGLHRSLEHLDERRFLTDFTYLGYRVAR